jgi:hypothetical protein
MSQQHNLPIFKFERIVVNQMIICVDPTKPRQAAAVLVGLKEKPEEPGEDHRIFEGNFRSRLETDGDMGRIDRSET